MRIVKHRTIVGGLCSAVFCRQPRDHGKEEEQNTRTYMIILKIGRSLTKQEQNNKAFRASMLGYSRRCEHARVCSPDYGSAFVCVCTFLPQICARRNKNASTPNNGSRSEYSWMMERRIGDEN